MTTHTFSIIIPCFNEVGAIAETIHAIQTVLADFPKDCYQLIIVNDGSTDGTGKILEPIAGQEQNITVINHHQNQGYGAALKTGLKASTTDYILITDADGTYPIDRIPDFVNMATTADMVVGSRTGMDVTYPFIRKLPKIFLKHYASWIANRNIPDINSGMRIFKREIAEQFVNILPDTFSFTTTITLAMMTNKYHVIYEPINYYHRIGKSKIRPIHDTLNFVLLIMRTGSYFAPLRVFGPFAFLLLLMGLLSLCYDIFWEHNITDKTMMFFMFGMNTGMFALLADMLHKKT